MVVPRLTTDQVDVVEENDSYLFLDEAVQALAADIGRDDSVRQYMRRVAIWQTGGMPGGTRDVGAYGVAVAQVLTRAREHDDRGLRALAEELPMSFAQLGRMFAGDRGMTLDEFVAICSTLGADPVEVLREAEAVVSRERVGAVVGEGAESSGGDGAPTSRLASE